MIKIKVYFNLFFSGRDFRWSPSEASDQYLDILPLFADERSALFGVHQLSMVNSDEKAIGSWIGPNGVAQVSLKFVKGFEICLEKSTTQLNSRKIS